MKSIQRKIAIDFPMKSNLEPAEVLQVRWIEKNPIRTRSHIADLEKEIRDLRRRLNLMENE